MTRSSRIVEVVERGYLNRGPRLVLEQLARYVARSLGVEPCQDSGECCPVHLWAPPERHCVSDVFFFAAAGPVPGYVARRLARLEVSQVAPGFYVVYRVKEPSRRAYFRVGAGGVVEAAAPCPASLLSLLSSAAEAGRLRVRDAVEVLASNLGLKRAEAREIVQGLAKRLCILVRDGYVVLLD